MIFNDEKSRRPGKALQLRTLVFAPISIKFGSETHSTALLAMTKLLKSDSFERGLC